MNRKDFERWITNLMDANEDTLLPWFDKVKPDFNEAWNHLHASWTHEELAHAYMKQTPAINR